MGAFGAATVAALLLTGYLVVGEPLVGRQLHRRFEALLGRRRTARTWFYQRLLLLEWTLAALVLAVVPVAPGVGPGQLGFTAPRWAPGPVLVALALLAFAVLTVVSLLRGDSLAGAPAAVTAMLPRTAPQRRAFALVSLTAGFCEELVYRGFLLLVLGLLVPVALPVLVVLGGLAFGAAHAYQGLGGMIGTSVLGGALSYVYLGTGSLLLPVVLHALIDLRLLALPPRLLPAESLG